MEHHGKSHLFLKLALILIVIATIIGGLIGARSEYFQGFLTRSDKTPIGVSQEKSTDPTLVKQVQAPVPVKNK